jgi:hypothetical protein
MRLAGFGVSILTVISCSPLVSYAQVHDAERAAFRNWVDVYRKIGEAVWLPHPQERLEAIREEIRTRGLEYEKDPLPELERAKQFVSQLSPEDRVLYNREVAFRAAVRVDTLFTIGREDLDGDGTLDQVLGRVYKQDAEVFGSVMVVSAQDTSAVARFDASVPEGWSGFPELRTYFYTAVRVLKEMEFDAPQKFFHLGVVEWYLKGISAEVNNDVLASISQYADTFKGKALSFYYGGSYGGTYMWYAPLNRFILIYHP